MPVRMLRLASLERSGRSDAPGSELRRRSVTGRGLEMHANHDGPA